MLSAFIAADRLVADRLRRAPAFATLPSDRAECLAVLRQGTSYELPAEFALVSPGDAAALIVVIEGGLFDRDRALHWPAGSCLGVAELLADAPFATSLATVAPTSIYRLDAALFGLFRRGCPAIAQCIIAGLADAHAPEHHAPTRLPALEPSA